MNIKGIGNKKKIKQTNKKSNQGPTFIGQAIQYTQFIPQVKGIA